MKYLLVIVGPESGMEDISPEEMKASLDRWGAMDRELIEAGVYIAGEGLHPSATASTVRIGADGERVITDGPFAETKEQVGGFYLIETENLDEALEWAKKIPAAPGAAVEVRSAMDFSEFGYESATPSPRAVESSR